MTTVGYGDDYPTTTIEMCIGGICMLVGIVIIALPIAIIGNRFQEVYSQNIHDINCELFHA